MKNTTEKKITIKHKAVHFTNSTHTTKIYSGLKTIVKRFECLPQCFRRHFFCGTFTYTWRLFPVVFLPRSKKLHQRFLSYLQLLTGPKVNLKKWRKIAKHTSRNSHLSLTKSLWAPITSRIRTLPILKRRPASWIYPFVNLIGKELCPFCVYSNIWRSLWKSPKGVPVSLNDAET